MQNKNSKFNTVLLVLILVLVGFGIWKMSDKNMVKNNDTNVPAVEQMDRSLLSGNADDLVEFSIWPGTKVKGIVSYRGSVKGAYFFEANILVGVSDINKNIILQSNAMATSDWMTVEPVEFEGNLDFSTLPNGPAYIEIHNDNASGLPENDKAIYIPIIINN